MTQPTETGAYPSSNVDGVDGGQWDPMVAAKQAAQVSPLLDLEYLKSALIDFITLTTDARMLSERCRDYFDGRQWTAEQVAALKKRKQAPIVSNRIKVKLNGLLGLTSARKGDPKAYPRNNDSDSEAAEAVTDGLRYAADKCKLSSTFLECADNFFCEGYTGVNVVTEQCANGDSDVCVDNIPWDRLFFDPYSRKHDFSDARGKGFAIWMDEEDIMDAFPDADPDAFRDLAQAIGDETFQDRPRWVVKIGTRIRHMVVTHYIKKKGQWILSIYTGGGFLLPPMPSPYVDEYGKPDCPLELEHAYIDRENNRYGEIASFLDLQDEINHRRSKALFLLSQRQTFGNRGAVTDVPKAKRELAKPDGHLEVGQGEFNKDFGILPTGDMAQGQMDLLNDAKQEMDSSSYNAQLAGQRGVGDISGVALQKLQQAGMTELIKLFDNFGAFKLRVYKQMWNRIRQSWSQEKWIRVTDDEEMLRWVGFNIQITMQKFLQETMDDDSLPQPMRLGASAQMITLEKQNPQALQQLVMTKNKPAELDMDIILDEAYDTINISQEQLDSIMKFGAQNAFDIVDLLDISNITGKEKLIEKIENRRKEAAAQAQQQPDPKVALASAQAGLYAAKTQQVQQDSQTKAGVAQNHAQTKAMDLQTKNSKVQSENVVKQTEAQADVQKTMAETAKITKETEMLGKVQPGAQVQEHVNI